MSSGIHEYLDLPSLCAEVISTSNQTRLDCFAGDVDWATLSLETMKTGGAVAILKSKDRTRVVGLTKLAASFGDRSMGWRMITAREDVRLPGSALLRNIPELADVLSLNKITGVAVVSYHPQRRAVLRVTGHAKGYSRTYYVKLLRPAAYHRALDAHNILSAIRGRVRFLTPQAELTEYACLVWDAVALDTLHDRLRYKRPVDVRGLGLELRKFHKSTDASGLPAHSIEEERQATLKMLTRGSPLVPGLKGLIAQFTDVSLPQDLDVGVLHRDLHDKQILLSEPDVVLIDADGAANGPQLIDTINLVEHVRLRRMQGFGGSVQMERHLLESSRVNPGDPAAKVMTALICGRLAGVYACRPRWWTVTQQLVARSQSLLEAC